MNFEGGLDREVVVPNPHAQVFIGNDADEHAEICYEIKKSTKVLDRPISPLLSGFEQSWQSTAGAHLLRHSLTLSIDFN